MTSVIALASCGVSGTYVNNDTTIVLDDGVATITTVGELTGITLTAKASYEITETDEGRSITFTYTDGDKGILGAFFDGTKSFNQGSDDSGKYIEISGIKYYKQS